jgi:type III pantothenate kinase
MILELDCGNSWIKWRVARLDNASVIFSGVVTGGEQLLSALMQLNGLELSRARIVSVRNKTETQELICRLEQVFSIEVAAAGAVASLAGVSNGYYESTLLGADRWLAILAAYKLAAGACLVIDVGTAVTSDFVGPDGGHLGGYICPGLRLMSDKLSANTHGIPCLGSGLSGVELLVPGRSTAEAVGRGGLLMLRGFVEGQVQLANRLFGTKFQVFLTGGDAALVGELSVGVRLVPELVFIGLAVACP